MGEGCPMLRPAMRNLVTRIAKLPADTELKLGK